MRGAAARAAAILIAGPTASGKSALALALAERLGGTIVNADSMQVYGDLRILTARPSAAEEARLPHALYGHVDGAEAYSVGRWLADATAALAQGCAAGRLPIVVGGTGLYFKALLEGLSPIPPIPDAIRSEWRGRGEVEGAAALHRLLAERDPVMAARLAASDTQRLVRAHEVLSATGRSLADWQRMPGEPVLEAAAALRLVVSPEREALYARCDARLAGMLSLGALDEVARLMARQLDPALPVMRALGVAPLARHLSGECDRGAALAAAQRETRHYVKRQLTWLRRNMIAWLAVETKEIEREADRIVALVQSAR